MILKSAITDALITCDTFEIDEVTSLSIILIYISQGRDIITVLLILCYSDIAHINAACIWIIGWCNYANFNVFIDYLP